MPSCEESQAEPLSTAPLASSCRALRSATTPGYGRRMDDGKVRECDRDCACSAAAAASDKSGSDNSAGSTSIRADNACGTDSRDTACDTGAGGAATHRARSPEARQQPGTSR